MNECVAGLPVAVVVSLKFHAKLNGPVPPEKVDVKVTRSPGSAGEGEAEKSETSVTARTGWISWAPRPNARRPITRMIATLVTGFRLFVSLIQLPNFGCFL